MLKRDYEAVNKDNNFIYNDIVPSFGTLEPPGKATLAKAAPFTSPAANFQDIFSALMPLAVTQAMSSFTAKKDELVAAELERMREATQSLNRWENHWCGGEALSQHIPCQRFPSPFLFINPLFLTPISLPPLPSPPPPSSPPLPPLPFLPSSLVTQLPSQQEPSSGHRRHGQRRTAREPEGEGSFGARGRRHCQRGREAQRSAGTPPEEQRDPRRGGWGGSIILAVGAVLTWFWDCLHELHVVPPTRV